MLRRSPGLMQKNGPSATTIGRRAASQSRVKTACKFKQTVQSAQQTLARVLPAILPLLPLLYCLVLAHLVRYRAAAGTRSAADHGTFAPTHQTPYHRPAYRGTSNDLRSGMLPMVLRRLLPFGAIVRLLPCLAALCISRHRQ